MSKSYDSWGCTTDDSLLVNTARTQKYKEDLLKLANSVKDILSAYSQDDDNHIKFFLMDGTLLGAYRSGKMIEHDYDFDYGVYCTKEEFKDLFEFVKDKIGSHDPNYRCDLVDTYAYKMQLYDPTKGTHYLGNDWYNISLDIQLYIDHPENEIDLMQITYYKEDYHKLLRFRKEWFFPINTILFENFEYPAPANPEAVLKEIYGYLGKGGVFNNKTKRYDSPSIDSPSN